MATGKNMDNYQEILGFFAGKIMPGARTDYRMDGGNQSHFAYVMIDDMGSERVLGVDLERFGMNLQIPRGLFTAERFDELISELEYRLEQSRGKNVRLAKQLVDEHWELKIEA